MRAVTPPARAALNHPPVIFKRLRQVAVGRLSLRPAPIVWAGWLAGLIAPATLVAVPATDLWQRAHFSLTAYICLALALLGWGTSTDRARAVRGWIAFGAVAWTLLHALKNLEYALGALPVPPDVLLLGVGAGAAGAYRAVLVGRMPWREQMAVYLDAAVVAAAVSAALLAILLGPAQADREVATAALYGIVFVAIMAATVLLDLAVLAELEPRGAYAILAGLGLMGTGFVMRAGAGSVVGDAALDPWLISSGVVTIGYGTATWTDRIDTHERYLAIAGRLRNLLPLAAAVLAVLLLNPGTPADHVVGRTIVVGLALFALVGVVVRQSLLLWERDGVLRRLAAARADAERRTQQIAGMEAVGRLLAATGPTGEILGEVVDVIGERFGYDRVAVYRNDDGTLRLGAQRGYVEDVYPTLDGSAGVVGRVMRNRRPELVPDVTVDSDYLSADPHVRSEIAAPLLEGEELLGVLDVESTADDPLDETDFTAVVALADQLAASIALGLRRQRLLQERNFTAAVLDTLGALVIVTDPNGRVVRFNPACAEVSGYSMEELSRLESFVGLVPTDHRTGVASVVADVQAGGAPRSLENDWVRKDGSRCTISWWNRPVLAEDGTVEYVIATGIDITDRKQLETQLAHRALHDPLTGLPNRALLMDRLQQALRRRSDGSTTAVLFMDLDDFKQVNDALGHRAGDAVLTEVARRLVASVRPGDTAARVGGDEFVIVLEQLGYAEEAALAAERVLRAVCARPILINDRPVKVDASIGIATNHGQGNDADRLLGNADIAMYSAKTGGGGRCELFSADMHADIVRRRDIRVRLSAAIERGELLLYYQPILRLKGGGLTGAEALLRWNDPMRGLILPGEFLSVAEQTGLIVPIGAHVLRQACRQMAAWLRQPDAARPEWVSVNVSSRQFDDDALLDHVRGALREADLEPRRLVIEITESVMVEQSERTNATLRRLSELGVRFAVDDFGTGYSSLSYLRRFPIEFLKIDQSFIPGVDSDDQQAAFVGALVTMGRTLGLTVLAEGIETDAQYRALGQLGCELGQGYHLGFPVPGGELVPGGDPVPPRAIPDRDSLAPRQAAAGPAPTRRRAKRRISSA